MLIPTKLARPTVRPEFVQRPRLLGRLDEALERRLTVVSAPPGFGKSVLAAQWLERQDRPAAWLSLDPHDCDPERFVRYLVAAVEGASAHRLPETGALLDAQRTPPFEYLSEVLVCELARLEEALLVVLEDYHAVDSADVHRLMERLVPAMPPTLRLLVLTRRDPPWPLGHWRAQGWLEELRARDLRFNLEEARSFFAAGRPVPLSESTVERLQERVEGWIAGLRLVKLSLRGADRPEEQASRFSGTDRLVVDYLVGEVLAVQRPEVLEFLEVTAPLPRFCASLCDHLLAGSGPQPPARETLGCLERDNLFLVRLDPRGQWYRYHHLFQDLLLQHLPGLARRERLAEIHRRAGEWLAREGQIEEALREWIAAGEVDAAAALFGENLRAVIEADASRRVMSRWLALFPPGAEHGRVPLLVGHGYVALVRQDAPRLAALSREAMELLSSPSGPETGGERGDFLADVLGLEAVARFWSGDVPGALHASSGALESLPPRGKGASRALAALYWALAQSLSGEGEAAVALLERLVDDERAAEGPYLGVFLMAMGFVRLHAGRMDAVETVARRMLDAPGRRPLADYWQGWAFFLRAAAAYERNRLPEAEAAFRRIRDLRHRVSARLYLDALVGLCLVARARSDASGLERATADARAWALELGDGESLRIAESLEARLGLDAPGETRAAAPPVVPDFMSHWLEVPSLTYAERLLRGPSPESREAALPFIDGALERAEAHHNVRQSVPLSLLRALAQADRGEEEAALEVLAATVRRAEPLGLVRTFVDRGPRLRNLLEALASREGRSGYLEALLSACDGDRPGEGRPAPGSAGPADGADQAPSDLWKLLSNREVDVLELLADRLTNKEIADRLSISSETVKRHTRNLYEKLEVHGRREAVARALAERVILPRG